jgi:hypothetical protein
VKYDVNVVIQWVDLMHDPLLGGKVSGGVVVSYPPNRQNSQIARLRGYRDINDPHYILDVSIATFLVDEGKMIRVCVDSKEGVSLALQGFPTSGVLISGKPWGHAVVMLEKGEQEVEILVKSDESD